MSIAAPEPVLSAQARLGERPVWDDRAGELLWVDIDQGELHRYQPGAADRARRYAASVGCVALRENGGAVLGTSDGILLTDPAGEPEGEVLVPPGMTAGHFFNDGACDPAGRFYAGTSTPGRTPGAAALYRLDPDLSMHLAIPGVTESNGVAWSPDGATMYYVDSGTQDLLACGYDLATGKIGASRVLVSIDPGEGVPDGVITDSEGFLWLALWGGWSVRRYSPGGELVAQVRFPASDVTCAAFGGPDLADLYVTTSRGYLDDDQAAAQPLAGDLFLLRPGVTGRPAARFAG